MRKKETAGKKQSAGKKKATRKKQDTGREQAAGKKQAAEERQRERKDGQAAAGKRDARQEMAEDYRDIYDRIAKRCLSISAGCTVGLINGLFGTRYLKDSEVTYNWTENMDDGLKKTLADTIVTIDGAHSYHCEFQMKAEGDMILRVFEYDFHHAMRSRAGQEELVFPRSMVVYLYDEPIPEEYRIRIKFDGQTEVEYKVPVYEYIKRTEKDPEERDRLLALLPFQLLRLRRAIEKERTEENKEALKKLIEHDIVEVLEENVAAGKITAVEGKEIAELTRYLYGHIYGRYREEMAEVNKIMSGALRLPGDAYVRKIREQEETIAMLRKESKKQLQEKDKQLQEMAEANQIMSEALRLPGDAHVRKIREQEETIAMLQKESKKQLQEKDEQIAALKRQLEALQKVQ